MGPKERRTASNQGQRAKEEGGRKRKKEEKESTFYKYEIKGEEKGLGGNLKSESEKEEQEIKKSKGEPKKSGKRGPEIRWTPSGH